MEYEWGEDKRHSNIEKHGWDFAEAHKAWEQAPVVYEYAERKGEERWTGIGRIDNKTVSIVYQEKEDIRRIISMRAATEKERMHYERDLAREVGREDSVTKLIDSTRVEREQREISGT